MVVHQKQSDAFLHHSLARSTTVRIRHPSGKNKPHPPVPASAASSATPPWASFAGRPPPPGTAPPAPGQNVHVSGAPCPASPSGHFSLHGPNRLGKIATIARHRTERPRCGQIRILR